MDAKPKPEIPEVGNRYMFMGDVVTVIEATERWSLRDRSPSGQRFGWSNLGGRSMLVEETHVGMLFRSPQGFLWRVQWVIRKPFESPHVIAMAADPNVFDEATSVTGIFHERALVMCTKVEE